MTINHSMSTWMHYKVPSRLVKQCWVCLQYETSTPANWRKKTYPRRGRHQPIDLSPGWNKKGKGSVLFSTRSRCRNSLWILVSSFFSLVTRDSYQWSSVSCQAFNLNPQPLCEIFTFFQPLDLTALQHGDSHQDSQPLIP